MKSHLNQLIFEMSPELMKQMKQMFLCLKPEQQQMRLNGSNLSLLHDDTVRFIYYYSKILWQNI